MTEMKQHAGQGNVAEVRRLLDAGEDAAPLGWSPLHRAVALGTVADIKQLLEEGADIEARDGWKLTPFLLAIQTGDTEKVSLLLDYGAAADARGHWGKPAAHYALPMDDWPMLRWLIERGVDPNAEDQSGHPAVVEALAHEAVECFRGLLENGTEWEIFEEEIIFNNTSPAIANLMEQRGVDVGKFNHSLVRHMIGLPETDGLDVTEEEYLTGRFRRFGTANPERMDVKFWQEMVRCGWNAYRGAKKFGDCSFDRNDPVWCHERFGMSFTRLPDGRIVQVAGEHEDHYDPDFCIYNDVIVHDDRGDFEIFGYPEEIFPPTDFHSATLVGEWIYLIGNLGYRRTREANDGRTPVFRLRVGTWEIERVSTIGESPGWIHKHRASLEGNRIIISGGKILNREDGSMSDSAGVWSFDHCTHEWRED